MKFYSTPAFVRLFNKLASSKKQSVKESIEELIKLYATGLHLKGLGLKRMGKDLWEIRSSLKDRILFSICGDTVYFHVVGNHDDIRKYLKNL